MLEEQSKIRVRRLVIDKGKKMEVIQRDDCTAFVTKDGSVIRELLAHRNSSIRNQSLAEAIVGPGIRTQAHFHPKTEEIYYVLSGVGLMHLGNESREVGPGDAIAIPPGTVHWIQNPGALPLVFLCACSPAYEHEDTVMVEV
jgi:mannose-6-phosphate isomerase-like protein (cupin superfamily)